MKVVINELAPCKRGLEVEIPSERVSQELERTFQEYSRHARLAGFRKGHIPLEVVRQRFAKEVQDEVVGRLVREEALRILDEKKIDPVEPPVLEEVRFERGQPLSFRATFEVRPDVPVLDYHGLSVSVPRHEVTDAMVDAYLGGLADRAARLEAVSGRPVQKGDYAVGALSCRFLKGKGKNLEQENFMLEAGSEENHPDFNAALLGMSVGETRSFEVDYPEDSGSESLRGCRVAYTLTLREIKIKVVPPIDDDLAREIGDFSALPELRAKVRAELERRAAGAERDAARSRLLGDLVRRHPVEVPESLIDAQIDARLEGMARDLISRGLDPTKAGVDWAEERGRIRPAAVDAVRAMMILDSIAAREGLSASDEEINAWLKEEARRASTSVADLKEKLAQTARLTGVRRQIVREKSLDFLLRDATITHEVK